MKMTDEECTEIKQKRVAEVAKGILDGSICYLGGAIELASLRFDDGLPEDDPDFLAFSGVSSETDHLPIGQACQYWSKQALEKHEPEI
jgi:hypothetical protein